jgi:hypothetical protein
MLPESKENGWKEGGRVRDGTFHSGIWAHVELTIFLKNI